MPGACRYALLILLLVGGSSARADHDGPSFDCAKAGHATDKIICNNEELSRLDRELAVAYKARLAELDDVGRAALQRDEKRWIDRRMKECARPTMRDDVEGRVACIEWEYRQRLGAMQGDCEVDAEHSLEEIATWKRPSSSKIPKGFSAQRRVEIYRNNEFIEVHNLPSTTLPAAKVSGWGWRCCGGELLASCRAKSADGVDWIVFYTLDGLEYIPIEPTDYGAHHDNIEPASIYDARVTEEYYKHFPERRKQGKQ